ncbi:Glycosyltransferases, probably involved in cell wall biogenesis [Cupriavidus gilardii J11]|uniref:Glycosyltransferases, probably involved in cell wall biogenesis n=1 Tax=Cupriavidus gilardii J11 TaxID=936133 RepID=A0A562BMI5_9BURK|nr:glycosyltransferase [Cupriavidus gilardii]TWG86424.1 Glycosyltransferases, probably involved in cell wall biogenesis [Cupriavidus gilardii J11]
MLLPLVSIIIPAYNHERFVKQCLDSAFDDPYDNKEIVIIDDGSTDATPERIAQWVDAHRQLVNVTYISRPNRGVTATLNELAQRASGEYLRLGASDDYFLPGGLRAQVEYLVAHPEKDAVIGDSIVVDNDNNVLHQSGMVDLHGADKSRYATTHGLTKEVICRWAVGGPVPMVRKSAFERMSGWDESLRIDDWDFFLRLAARGALGFIDKTVCAYRVHGDNTCRTRDSRARIANLTDARGVAERNAPLFDEPYRTMLRAQVALTDAKIAFLQRSPARVAAHMARYFSLMAAARMKEATMEPAARRV